MLISKLPTARNVPAHERLSRRAGVIPVIADLEFANAKFVEMGMPGLLIGESDRDVRQSDDPTGRDRVHAYRPAPR
jgi:hypothetical protein